MGVEGFVDVAVVALGVLLGCIELTIVRLVPVLLVILEIGKVMRR